MVVSNTLLEAFGRTQVSAVQMENIIWRAVHFSIFRECRFLKVMIWSTGS